MISLQLNPMIPVDTPKGPGFAFVLIDYSQEHHLLFVCAIDSTREIWTFPTKDLKFQKNVSMGRESDILAAERKKAFERDVEQDKIAAAEAKNMHYHDCKCRYCTAERAKP